ncbi:TPA: ProQ/FINO family protein [Salmonella enterica subsp. diarizonae serovar 60-67:z35:-]
MTTASINRKSAQSQVSTWQDTLRDYKAQMTSKKMQQTQQNNGTGHGQNNHTFPRSERDLTTSAHKVKPDSDRTPQKSTGVKINASEAQEPTSQTAKQNPGQAQERVRPEGMSRRQWKNFKHMRRVLAFWPELFNLDEPKPLKVGVLDDIQRDIAARGLVIGAGALKAAVASYVRRIRYQKAIAAGGARYDINGQPCGEVTPEQQQEAADELKNRDNG